MFIQYTSSPPHYFPSSQTWIINWPPSIRHLVTTTSHAHYINVGFTNSSVCATNPTLLHESDLQEGRSSSTNVKQTNHCRNPASIHRNGTQFNFMTSFHLPISKLCDVHFARFSWYHHHPNATPIRPQQIECHVSMADQLDTNPHLSSTCSESTIFLLHLSNLGSRFFPTGGGCDGWNTKMIDYTFNYNPTEAFPYYYSHMQLDMLTLYIYIERVDSTLLYILPGSWFKLWTHLLLSCYKSLVTLSVYVYRQGIISVSLFLVSARYINSRFA
jgi:hypothetical protein